jgi:integrase/recombinase XerD
MTALRHHLQDYLTLRRALGYQLEREGRLLPTFVTFLDAQQSPHITTALALAWATQPSEATPYWIAKRLTMVRGWARYLSARDRRTEIPAVDLVAARTVRQPPYLYSAADVRALLHACAQLRGSLRPATYTTLVGLLAVTGMRVGEALALDRTDVDLREPRLLLRHTKFNKTREIPLHPSTSAVLHTYAHMRDRVLRRPHSPSFFLSTTGTRLLPQNVWHTFARLRQVAGLPSSPRPPRIHDLRHSFAMQTLLRWSHEDVDIHPRMPLLSTYLGHVHPSMTYWYLTATPELLELAAARRQRGATS